MEQDIIDRISRDLGERGVEADVSGLAVTGRVLRLARSVEAARDELLGEFGLSVADFDVMATLRRRAEPSGLKAKHVQASVMITSGGMTKRLDRLESAGLIERLSDPDDRRGVLIALTTAGRQVIDEALPALLAAEAKMIGEAIGSARDRERLVSLLR
ncbi:MAG: MarR family transcriptional regulator, partial [Acidimicrobiia bacterium]